MSTIVAITQFSGWSLVLFIAINVLVILIGAVAQFQLSREQFIASKDHNINSGRLNLIDGWWNLEANLHFAHPSEERKKQQWAKNVRRLSPLVTAFGFMVARAIEGDMQSLFIAFGGYILGYIISVLVSAKHLAIALQLKTWEKEYEMDIKI